MGRRIWSLEKIKCFFAKLLNDKDLGDFDPAVGL
jgi:hypothetical protein